ncbi:fluoride efflux transporter FluC [Streptomyces sp. NRRL S-118]|uniref:fluoride efflux transporter FluC n=1 Tax=Streptomyces sp. NRRL S-118 TaxID=1463881 RepID=UPI0004C85837|nr:CrcB family protein [Streptomyces sp. NRRL S-118]
MDGARGRELAVVGVVAAGGALGAAARYGVSLAWPAAPGGFPWATLWINGSGCALIGVLLVAITEGGAPVHRLVRPFLGTGVLGGFTTFSTYAGDVERLLRRHETATALGYLWATVVVALGAVWSAAWATRRVLVRRAA